MILIAQLERNGLPGTTTSSISGHLTAGSSATSTNGRASCASVAIAKDDTCLRAARAPRDLSHTECWTELRGGNFLRDLGREEFLDRLTYYNAELNAAHPFREGNGRTQRAFLGQLARDAGYTLAWQRLERERNIEAARASHRGDNSPLHELLDELLDPRT